MYNCEILADSLNHQGDRITTMKVTFPRFILAEFNTHRMFSRNSASSRAIPFKKMVQMVEETPFVPIAWQKDHKGMQGTEYITDSIELRNCTRVWLDARNASIDAAKVLHGDLAIFDDTPNPYQHLEMGVTKQICNRLLEPYMWHTVIVTATEWENFFKLRCPQYKRGDQVYRSWKDAGGVEHASNLTKLLMNESQAEIHIQAIAELMWDAMRESKPRLLKEGEWHIPFGDNMDEKSLWDLVRKIQPDYMPEMTEANVNTFLDIYRVKIAIARCARISYQTLGDNPKIDYEADLRLYDILANSGHYSPFEHVARAMSDEEYLRYVNGYNFSSIYNKNYDDLSQDGFGNDAKGWCRNFRGFIQQRVLID